MKLAPVMPLVLAAICAWNTSFGLAQQFSITIEVPEVFLLGCESSADGSLFATGGDCKRDNYSYFRRLARGQSTLSE